MAARRTGLPDDEYDTSSRHEGHLGTEDRERARRRPPRRAVRGARAGIADGFVADGTHIVRWTCRKSLASDFRYNYSNKLPHLVDTVPSPLLGVGAALLSKASHNVDETPVVLKPLARPSGGLLRLLLRGNLGRLTANLTRACEGAVHLTCKIEDENGV